jgi:hypothetical protein
MAVMRAHRFKLGQTVGIGLGSAGPAMPSGRYVVVRLMPSADGEPHYRVKSATDGREWALAEGQMRPVAVDSVSQATVRRDGNQG